MYVFKNNKWQICTNKYLMNAKRRAIRLKFRNHYQLGSRTHGLSRAEIDGKCSCDTEIFKGKF